MLHDILKEHRAAVGEKREGVWPTSNISSTEMTNAKRNVSGHEPGLSNPPGTGSSSPPRPGIGPLGNRDERVRSSQIGPTPSLDRVIPLAPAAPARNATPPSGDASFCSTTRLVPPRLFRGAHASLPPSPFPRTLCVPGLSLFLLLLLLLPKLTLAYAESHSHILSHIHT